MHFSRHAVYSRLANRYPRTLGGDVLSIGPVGELGRLLTAEARVQETHWPPVDLQNLPFTHECFDAILADFVLEHLADPFAAAREMRRVLRPEGRAVITTALMYPYHPGPDYDDYFRFTRSGLRTLFRHFSEIEECSGWGTPAALEVCFQQDRRYEPITPGSALEPLTRQADGRHDIMVWIVARK